MPRFIVGDIISDKTIEVEILEVQPIKYRYRVTRVVLAGYYQPNVVGNIAEASIAHVDNVCYLVCSTTSKSTYKEPAKEQIRKTEAHLCKLQHYEGLTEIYCFCVMCDRKYPCNCKRK
jgi:hypothetical protein